MNKKKSIKGSNNNSLTGTHSVETSDDDHSRSGRGSTNSSMNYSDSGNSSGCHNQTNSSTFSPNTSVGITGSNQGILTGEHLLSNFTKN